MVERRGNLKELFGMLKDWKIDTQKALDKSDEELDD